MAAWACRNLAKLRWALLVALIVIASVVAARDEAKTTGRAAATAAQSATRRLLAKQCDRNQLSRAWQRVRAGSEVAVAVRYFPVVNCRATYLNARAVTVFLPRALDRCFVRLTASGYWDDMPRGGRLPTTSPPALRHLCATH